MKKRIALIALTALVLTACGKETSSVDIPFSTLSFNSTIEDMTEAFGEAENTDKSYIGTSYCYSSAYMDKDSEVRYSFDEDDKMGSITWLYESADGEEIKEVYNDIHKELEETYGQSGENTNDATQMADIWRLPEGNVTLVAVVSSDYNGIMYTYLSPEHSTSNEDAKKKADQ